MVKSLVTGSGGLIGSECVRTLAQQGHRVLGIDNDMRQEFFGTQATTRGVVKDLVQHIRGYRHFRHRYPGPERCC